MELQPCLHDVFAFQKKHLFFPRHERRSTSVVHVFVEGRVVLSIQDHGYFPSKCGRSVNSSMCERSLSLSLSEGNANTKIDRLSCSISSKFTCSSQTSSMKLRSERPSWLVQCTESRSFEETKQEETTGADAIKKWNMKRVDFVNWFREAGPYIQGHRSSIAVVVLPGEIIANRPILDGILQDILLLHGLGIKLVIIPGTHVQIDQLLRERGFEPQYEGAYRITDANALAASMEAAGRIRVVIEAKLSRGPSIPILRRHTDSDRWHEVAVSVASGNYLASKRRGVVQGVDFGSTGEVKRVDIVRIKERLNSNCIVLVSNLGYSASGEVLNCNTYEVATACAIALHAEKIICLLDGPILDDNQRLLRFMTLQEADKLIRDRVSQSSAAADYVKAVAGAGYVKTLGISANIKSGDIGTGSSGDSSGNFVVMEGKISSQYKNTVFPRSNQRTVDGGFAIGGEERLSRMSGYLSELTAAVFACRGGVSRVHLLDSNVEGALLLELYTRDGIGTMVSSDAYEGTRAAGSTDILSIMELLRPLEESGVLVNRPRKQLEQEVKNYTVVERDGSVIACAALFPYIEEKCGEVAAFAVSPECRGHGQGDSLLDYVERKAVDMKLERLFLLTTRTADWFVQRGFAECTIDCIPAKRKGKINLARGAKYYCKHLYQPPDYSEYLQVKNVEEDMQNSGSQQPLKLH